MDDVCGAYQSLLLGRFVASVTAEAGFRCLTVVGAFDLSSVGVVAAAVQPIAAAGISLFAYSTWQTDYLLVQEKDLRSATAALTVAGHSYVDA